MPHKTKIVIAATLLCLYAAVLFAAEKDLSEGFCDISWGAQAGTLAGLKEVANNGEVFYYTRTENPYEIYGADLGRVLYGFFNERLFSVFLDIAGKDKFEKTLEGLKGEYGPPHVQYRVGLDVYIWETGDVKIKLKHFEDQTIHKLAFYYMPLAKKLNKNQTESAEEIIFKLE